MYIQNPLTEKKITSILPGVTTQQTFWLSKLLGTSFQKPALRAFWGEARKGFVIQYYRYANNAEAPAGFAPACPPGWLLEACS